MKPKQFFFAMLGATVLWTALLGVAYYLGTQDVQARRSKLATELSDAAAADDKITQLQQLKHDYDKIQPLLPSLDDALPKTKNQSQLTLQIQQLASAAGLSLPGVAFQGNSPLPSANSQTVKAGDVLTMPVTFQLTGSYEQLQSFLQGLEHMSRLVSVTSLGISRVEGKPKTLVYSFTINAYLKP